MTEQRPSDLVVELRELADAYAAGPTDDSDTPIILRRAALCIESMRAELHYHFGCDPQCETLHG